MTVREKDMVEAAHAVDYATESQRLKDALRPLLTDEWLATAVRAARTYGWCGDYVEVVDFLLWLHEVARRDHPDAADTEPFQHD